MGNTMEGAQTPLDREGMPMVATFGCCASPESGHDAAAPPTSAMNSRRFMGAFHKPKDPIKYSRPEAHDSGG